MAVHRRRVFTRRRRSPEHVVDRDGTHGPKPASRTILAVLFDDFAAEGDLLVAVVIDVAPRLFRWPASNPGLSIVLAVLVEFLP